MADLALRMAEDSKYGYSQKPPSGRWGPDFDCSSFIYYIAHSVGYSVGIGKDKVRFTGTMLEDFKKAGFQILPFANVGISDLKIGDILLNLALHAEVYVGEGQVVGAQNSETGGFVGEAGDQTGEEIKKQPAYVYEKDWDYVLRPPQDEEEEPDTGEKPEEEGEPEMAYPYGNNTMGTGGNWMPNTGLSNMPRTTMPMGSSTTWMPPMQNYGYPQGNLGQMNGYSQANAGGYQQPNQMGGYQQQSWPQGGQGGPRHLIHVPELNDVRDVHVNPGECVPVFIGEGQHMALKSADQEGFPNMRVFRLIEETEEMMPQGNWEMGGSAQHQQSSGNSVSREEFDRLKEMIANVQSAISGSGFPQGNSNESGMGTQTNGNGSDAQSGKQSSGRNSRNS